MTSTAAIRPTLKEWQRDHWPEDKWRYAHPARNQMLWVGDSLAYMVWNSLLPLPADNAEVWSIDARAATLTVDGTHTSKSVLLPVYRFDVGGVVTKIRGNFHDWCVRCMTPMKRDFPEWMAVDVDGGFYEGMTDEKSPVAFCVRDRERLFAMLWWMYEEGLDRN